MTEKHCIWKLFVLSVLLVSLTVCGSAAPGDSESDSGLEAWEGTWNNFYSFFEDPGLEEAYETLASREGIPTEQVKARYIDGDTYQCEIVSLGIEGDQIIFYGETQTTAGGGDNIVSQGLFVFVGEEADANGRLWAHFETEDSIPYTHLLLLPAEADAPGETMMHFHFRYGDDLSTLLASDGWYATMVAYDNEMPLLIGHMTHRDIELSNWEGTWNNFYSYFEDPELEEAYETLAIREGISAEQVKSRYIDGETYQCEIAAFGIEGDSITFYTQAQTTEGSIENVLATADYTYSGQVEDDFGRTWSHFEADGDTPYQQLFLLPAEADNPGESMMHFHFRYGNDVDELQSAEGWYATMVRYDNDIPMLIEHMTFEH